MEINFRWLVIFGIAAIFQCFLTLMLIVLALCTKKSASK